MPSTAEAEAPATGTPPRAEISAALARLAADELVAYPTETVWGLGALARSDAALAVLRRFKGRDEHQPISVLVSGADELESLGFEVSARARQLMRAFWPGPITLVLPCSAQPFARGIARAGDGAVGLRCSPHPVAAELVRAVSRAGLGPITATSLNRSGEAPVTSREAALELCSAATESPTVLPAGEPGDAFAPPSTVVDLSADRVRILRPGAIGRAAIERVVGTIRELEVNEAEERA